MKRREFIRNSATGSAFLFAGGAYAFQISRTTSNQKYGFQSERKIPVAYNVDVVVVGGSMAAVAAAVEASKAGASVFLIAREPYLGEDICGTYRLWTSDKSATATALGNKIFGSGLPTPMHVKSTLDNALIDQKIGFLYSCFVTDLVVDADGKPAGVVMANRSGRQAIVAKTIIDATPRAQVARLAGAKFAAFPEGKQKFSFTVVGNDLKNLTGLTTRIYDEPIVIQRTRTVNKIAETYDTSYTAIEYTTEIDMPDNSWRSFATAEQVFRDLVWDANQVDSADLLFQNPLDKMVGQKKWTNAKVDSETIGLAVFQPEGFENLFVLSGSASLGHEAAETLLQPGMLARIGERVGQQAAKLALSMAKKESILITGTKNKIHTTGNVGELLEGLRPTQNEGEILATETSLPVLGEFDVVVMGGGTAGAPAAVGAAKKGAKTLVIEYLHNLGGIGTAGMVGRYYHGYREGYTNLVDKAVQNMGGPGHPRSKKSLAEWVFDWKSEYFRKEISNAGGEIWFGAIGIGAYSENGMVKGLVVATPEGRGLVLAHTVIDSTGSADIAIAAGASYNYTDGNSVAVQGAGLPFKNPDEFYNNSDWTFINDSDLIDVWSAFILAKDKFINQYDIGKLPQTRERRRMTGDFTVSVLDVYNGRTYPDTISAHLSSFDTHGFTEDPFFSLKPPEHSGVDVLAFMPFRSLLPKGFDGIVVTGLGASAHRDAMPVLRMQPCLQNQGFAVGMAAAEAARKKQNIRDIDLKALQKELVEMKNLPEHVLTDSDNFPPSMEKVQAATETLTDELKGLEIVLWDLSKGIPALSDKYYSTPDETGKLVYARILGMLGIPDGWKELVTAIDGFEDWDKGWNFTGMGQFGRSISYLDSLIIAAGRTKRTEALPSIFRLMEKLTPESEFSHFRAVAMALETIAGAESAEPLFKVLQMPDIMGHSMPDIQTARKLTPRNVNDVSTRNNSLRELILGRALYKCGDFNNLGNQILNNYSKDLRGHYYRHANGVLKMFVNQKLPETEL